MIDGVFAFQGGEAYDSGMAPYVILESTHESALEMVPLEKLQEYAYKED